MNAMNAVVFAALGSVMEILPRLFPSWFPPTGSDQSSTRALWLAVMGALQMALGAGFIVRCHLVPAIFRIFTHGSATEQGALALPSARVVTGR
jgi:hypothetical protein